MARRNRLPFYALTVSRLLGAEHDVVISYWWRDTSLRFQLDPGPGVTVTPRILSVLRGDGYRRVKWCDVWSVEGGGCQYIDPRLLWRMPRNVAQDIAAEEPASRVVDSLRRALANGRRFGPNADPVQESYIAWFDRTCGAAECAGRCTR